MLLSELMNSLNELLLPEQFQDYSPNGLQIQGKNKIQKIGFAVSATLESISQSIEWGADALIVHHGLFWKHQGAKTITGPWGERVKLCIKNDINLIAFHLPLDAHTEVGNAAALSRQLKLEKVAPFGPYKGQFLGMKGEFPRPLKAKKLKEELQKILQHHVILASPNSDALVKSIGIITGGANNEWPHALDEGLDAYLTGEISEYNWHDSIEAGIHFLAGGHHATEKFGIQELMKKIHHGFLGIEVKFFDSQNLA